MDIAKKTKSYSNLLIFGASRDIIDCSLKERLQSNVRVWRRLVARLTGGQEAASSSLVTRTMKKASFVYQDKRGFFLLSGQKTSKYMQFRASERSIGFSGARFFVFSGENGLKMLVSFLRFFADAKNA